MHDTITRLLSTYGYVFLAALVAVESAGIPLPGETALVTAAAYAALGRMHIVLVIAAAAAGAILGDNAGYWVGRKGGLALVRRFGRRVGLTEAKLDRAHAFFERHGAKTVFIGRFVALLRSWAAALAGVACMPYGTFLLWNALGGVVWATLFGVLGYAFGRNLPLLERYVGRIGLAVALFATLVVAVMLAMRWFRANRTRLGVAVTERWRRVATSPRFVAARERHPRAWAFVAARFARGEYLGLHLTVGFALSVAALWLFGGITEDVINHEPITLVDLHLAAWFRAHATPLGDRVATAVTMIGSPAAMGLVALVVAIVLATRRRWIVLGGWLAAFVGAGGLDWALKRIVHRPRPLGANAHLFALERTFSFPSGHAMGSLVGYGMLAWVLAAYWPWARRERRVVFTIATALVLAIGATRLYLGVHFLSDVLGGYAAGILWLTTCVTGLEIALRQRGLAPWEVGVERRRVARDPVR